MEVIVKMRAKLWIPLSKRGVLAEFPLGLNETSLSIWLKRACRVKTPWRSDKENQWILSPNSLNGVIIASLDRFGEVEIWRDMKVLARCDKRCQEAQGDDCNCSCLSEHHGESAANKWYEVGEFALVKDSGGFKRIRKVLIPPRKSTDPRPYTGELRGMRYTTRSKSRKDWPAAANYICSACVIEQAKVWDHCHAHGYVRAPLCGACNTWMWNGWSPEISGTQARRNVDISYYGECPSAYLEKCSK